MLYYLVILSLINLKTLVKSSWKCTRGLDSARQANSGFRLRGRETCTSGYVVGSVVFPLEKCSAIIVIHNMTLAQFSAPDFIFVFVCFSHSPFLRKSVNICSALINEVLYDADGWLGGGTMLPHGSKLSVHSVHSAVIKETPSHLYIFFDNVQLYISAPIFICNMSDNMYKICLITDLCKFFYSSNREKRRHTRKRRACRIQITTNN